MGGDSEWVGVGCWLLCVCVGVDRYSGRLCMHCPCAPGRSCAAVFNLLGPMFVCLAIVAFASRSVISLIPASLHSYRPATIRSTVNGPTSVVSASPTRIELNLWTLTANLESHRFPEFRGLELRIAAKRPWVCAPASRPGSQQPQASTASHATHPRARAPDPPQHHKDPPGPHNTTPG